VSRQRGFALIAVLLVLAMVGVLGAEFAYSMRLEATSVRAYKDTLTAAHLAEAAIAQGIREIAGDVTYAVVTEDDSLTFYNRDRLPLKRLPRTKVPLGVGQFSYRITDEEARLNLNASPPDRVDRLLQAMGLDKSERDTINDSIQDWRDTNDEHRVNGAESEDYYLKLPLPYRAKNSNLDSITELLQIKGVTPAIYNGVGGPGEPQHRLVRRPARTRRRRRRGVLGYRAVPARGPLHERAGAVRWAGAVADDAYLPHRGRRSHRRSGAGAGDGHRPAQRAERRRLRDCPRVVGGPVTGKSFADRGFVP
jgi:type II secretion system (T2SS) protein K